jgi:alanyl-tRNA synthetase
MDEKEYQNEFFRQKGFVRQTCRGCGSAFWSERPRELCSETPCTPYSFPGNSPIQKSYSADQFRELYLHYFEQRGHTRIARYPVVPRWRDDVFFVQASIYDFQPWVTSGAVEPPANPLVISQPCLRFTDVTEVGVTQRHLTSFEMMAHHCFNYPGREIYFKDRTVELCHEFLTSELGVDGTIVSYKEEEWEGGGDMGPSLSVGLSGLEVATLVFMQYTNKGGVVRPLPLRIVDTGYGLERFTWISQGTPTIYDAVFGEVFRDLPSTIAPKDLAVLVDHSRSFVLMLTDGVVPSNVHAGYLARMLLRRMLRILARYPNGIGLIDVMEQVRRHLSRTLPGLDLSDRTLRQIVEIEEQRFSETLERGRSHIRKLKEKLDQEGRKISVPELLTLYDSRGITPDIVEEELGMTGLSPPDFFALAAKLHQEGTESTEKPGAPAEDTSPPDMPSDLPPTRVLYHTDPYTLSFSAKIVWAFESWVVLESTYFYPTGGGQITDTGKIAGVPISEVVRKGPWVYHRVAPGHRFAQKTGETVPCEILGARRQQLMQHHTATHILNGALRRLLGPHVWQAGAFKGMEEARLDVTHFRSLTPTELRNVERLANQVIREDRPVKSYFLPRSEAENRFGFSIYQGGAVPGKELRIVEIDGFDVEACGGTHCTHTSEAGYLRVLSTERIQDGMVRLHFAAGERALDIVDEQAEILHGLSVKLAQPITNIPRAVDELLEKKRLDERATRKNSSRELADLARRLETDPSHAIDLGNSIRAIWSVTPVAVSQLQDLARLLSSRPGTIVLLAAIEGDRWTLFFASGSPDRFSARDLLDGVLRIWPGKGGGNASAARASGPAQGNPESLLESALTVARSLASEKMSGARAAV